MDSSGKRRSFGDSSGEGDAWSRALRPAQGRVVSTRTEAIDVGSRAFHLVIDARPAQGRGARSRPRWCSGRACSITCWKWPTSSRPRRSRVSIHAREEEHGELRELPAARCGAAWSSSAGRLVPTRRSCGPIAITMRGRLKRGLRRGRSPESAVLWRLDRPETLAPAEEELTRRRSYQPLGKYWAFPLAERLAEWLEPTAVRPNAVTLASAGLMLSAAAVVAAGIRDGSPGSRSRSCLAVALVLDTADGRLARLQGTSSAFGRWLDQVLDELADMVLHAAIAWAAFCRDGQPGWLLLGMLYASSKYLFQVQSLLGEELERDMKRAADSRRHVGDRREGRVGRIGLRGRLAALLRLIGHADLRWHLWIALAFLGRLDLALASYAVYFALRATGGALRKGVRYA